VNPFPAKIEYEEAVRLSQEFNHKDAPSVLQWATERFGDGLALACSFGAEDVVLVDLISKFAPNSKIFVLDTGRLHQETYDVMDQLRQTYKIEFETLFPDQTSVQQLLSSKGPNSMYESVDNRKECCGIRKVEPLKRALFDKSAWITGLRRSQSVTRANLAKIEVDFTHGGIAKLNPLADWTEEQVWAYIRLHNVPYNSLHDQGFPSIGCAACTRAVKPGDDVRAGRWWWETPEQKECGLHVRA